MSLTACLSTDSFLSCSGHAFAYSLICYFSPSVVMDLFPKTASLNYYLLWMPLFLQEIFRLAFIFFSQPAVVKTSSCSKFKNICIDQLALLQTKHLHSESFYWSEVSLAVILMCVLLLKIKRWHAWTLAFGYLLLKLLDWSYGHAYGLKCSMCTFYKLLSHYCV